MLAAEHLTRRFGQRVAVEDATFEIERGEIFALLGPNGAGKTTTLRMLAGLIEPSAGEVLLGGHRVARGNAARLRAQVGFLTESPGLWDRLTVRDNLLTYARLHGLPLPGAVVERSLAAFNIADRADEPAALLSKGLKQRVALARTLLHNPDIVLLDEPTSGLDPESARDVREMILSLRDDNRAVVLSTHNLDEVDRVATRVAVLRQRLLALDTPQSLRARLFGHRLRVVLTGQAGAFIPALRAGGHADVAADDNTLSIATRDAMRDTPDVVRLLVEQGAAVVSVLPEEHSLEDVYLRLVRGGTADMSRIVALVSKEFADLRHNPGVFLPALLTAIITIVLPFVVAVIVPAWTGEHLSDSSDLQVAMQMLRTQHALNGLEGEAAVQAWIFQQFLPLLVLAPVAASMSVAAYTVIGEKQARTLEPLLATPITTFELLSAKVLGALVPAVGLTLACFAIYGLGILVLAQSGAARILVAPRSLGMVFILGPLAALAALQLAVCVSSRVNDARSAQQIGALIILPLAGLLVGQLTGTVALTGGLIAAIAGGLAVFNVGLMRVGIALFDRESILTRWK